jgi:hypothetical protein
MYFGSLNITLWKKVKKPKISMAFNSTYQICHTRKKIKRSMFQIRCKTQWMVLTCPSRSPILRKLVDWPQTVGHDSICNALFECRDRNDKQNLRNSGKNIKECF